MSDRNNTNYAASSLNDASIEGQNRLYYLDWIRVFATFFMFLYHCSIFFDFRNYFIQDTVRALGPTIFREFCQIWLMPLYFMVSGASIYYSLRFRNAWGFVKERIRRIFIPFVIIGLFLIAPPQVYLVRLLNGDFTGSFFQWYPHYFDGFYPYQETGNFAVNGMHLWYLQMLFIYSLILLPIFIPFGKTKASIISRISPIFERPWTLLLLFIPLGLTSILTDVIGLGIWRMMGGWDQFSYIVFFIYGYLIFSNERIRAIIKKYSTACLVAAVILTGIFLYMQFGTDLSEISFVARHNLVMNSANTDEMLSSFMSLPWAGILFFRSLTAWCWLFGLFGLGSRIFNFKNKISEYCNDLVLPFYILHMTIIYIIGFYVIQWKAGTGDKYMAITAGSFIGIMAIYELLIRRINVLRFLFGIKWKKKSK